MGGPCLQYVRPPYGEHQERLCPPCTDNFQVVPGGFEYDGMHLALRRAGIPIAEIPDYRSSIAQCYDFNRY